MSLDISVMIVEDNPNYREALSLMLNSQSGIGLYGQFGTAEAAIQHLSNPNAPKPHVILLDLRLPGMSGSDAILKILKLAPNVRIIVLTQSDRGPDVLGAITAGALGYLLKSASAPELVKAIRAVTKGEATIDSAVAKFVFDQFRNDGSASEDAGSILSDRETEVMQLLAQGLAKKEIATELGIGYSTVDTHVSRIYAKLEVNNAPGAVNRAHILGLLK